MKGEHRDDVDEKNENQTYNNYEMMGNFGETEIWRGSEQDEELIADSSIFYNVFPTLADFPCMSSTSSSSSTPALTKQFVSSNSKQFVSSNSSTSSASSVVRKSDVSQEQQGLKMIKYELDGHEGSALSCTDGSGGMEYVDCMDVMEDFGYMDLIEDGNDLWDPSSIFQDDDNQVENKREPENREDGRCCVIERGKEVVEEKMGVDDLGVMFFEWLKTNKEHISAEDMKNIKFKKATIECAYKRMGCTKEGKKQLLKLILEWVEQYQLLKKRSREEAAAMEAASSHQVPCQYQEPSPSPNPNPKPDFINFIPTPDPNACMWIPKTQSSIDLEMVMPAVSAPPAVAYHQYPFVNGANVAPMNCQPYPPQMPQTDYQMLECARSWPRSQFVVAPHQYYNSFTDQNGNFVPIAPQPVAPVYGEQYPSQVYNGTNNSERVVKLPPSATKEARKKRMARKKRGSFHRHHPHQNQIQKTDSPEKSNEGKLGAENCTNNICGQSNPVNWPYWPPIGTSKLPQPPVEAQSPQLEGHLGYSTLPLVQAQSSRPLAQSDRGGKQQKKQVVALDRLSSGSTR